MAINRATFQITDGHLEQLVLEQADLPGEFSGHQMVREGLLDNRTMAEQGFPGNTEDRFREAGRITGFLREFGPTTNMQNEDGFNFLGATVAHLFDDSDSVSTWMNEIFVKDFEQNVGERVGEDHQLVSVKRLETDGFYDEAVSSSIEVIMRSRFHMSSTRSGVTSRSGFSSIVSASFSMPPYLPSASIAWTRSLMLADTSTLIVSPL